VFEAAIRVNQYIYDKIVIGKRKRKRMKITEIST